MEHAMRESTQKMMREQIAASVRARDLSDYGRAQEELPPLDVVVCLGPGRCMFPRQGSAGRVCAYCLRYPKGHNSAADVAEQTRRLISGN